MVLQRLDPVAELRRMDNVMNRFWRSYPGLGSPARPQGWAVPLDVRQRATPSPSMPPCPASTLADQRHRRGTAS